MNILLWHVHGGWTDAFVRGSHDYWLPSTPDHGPWGLGRAGRDWPRTVHEIAPEQLRDLDVDLVLLQRPAEIARAEALLGRRPGRDLPAVYLEHNTPRDDVPNTRHPLAERTDIPLVHVTYFNELFWDSGRAPTTVIEHGIVDPGALYTGAQARFGAVINEPLRRWRVTGTDLLPRFAELAPVDVFGINGAGLGSALRMPGRVRHAGDLPTHRLHSDLAEHRVYLHPFRWTSLGLALLEAMHLAMPVLALASTEAIRAVPPEAGGISTDVDELRRTARVLLNDPDEARHRGRLARSTVLERYGLDRFLARWDAVLAGSFDPTPRPARAHSPGR